MFLLFIYFDIAQCFFTSFKYYILFLKLLAKISGDDSENQDFLTAFTKSDDFANSIEGECLSPKSPLGVAVGAVRCKHHPHFIFNEGFTRY